MRYPDRFRVASLRVSLLVAVGFFAGCPHPPVQVRPYPAPTAAELLSHVQKSHAGMFALRARAKADVTSREGSVKVDIALVAARPQRLRLAGENSLTGPLLTLATDGTKFQLLDVRENRFESGVVSPCNMSRILGVALHPSQVIEVLMGGVPILPNPTSSEVSWDGKDGGREVLTLRNDQGLSEVIYLSAEGRNWDVREAEGRDTNGQPVWILKNEGFTSESIAGKNDDSTGTGPRVRLPASTYIEDPPHKSKVRLRWREREMNPDVDAAIFEMAPPEGVPTVPDVCASLAPQQQPPSALPAQPATNAESRSP